MVFDIADILFREILGCASYPGSPFTGEIFRDIILFFFIPTVFLIIFVYVTASVVIPPGNQKLRLLMGLAIYAFIIASRYYEGFAIFASQFYFVFIIFIGIIYFLGRHFRRPGGGGMAYEHGGGGMAYEGGHGEHDGGHGGKVLNPLERHNVEKEISRIDDKIANLQKKIDVVLAQGQRVPDDWAREIRQLENKRDAFQERLKFDY